MATCFWLLADAASDHAVFVGAIGLISGLFFGGLFGSDYGYKRGYQAGYIDGAWSERSKPK